MNTCICHSLHLSKKWKMKIVTRIFALGPFSISSIPSQRDEEASFFFEQQRILGRSHPDNQTTWRTVLYRHETSVTIHVVQGSNKGIKNVYILLVLISKRKDITNELSKQKHKSATIKREDKQNLSAIRVSPWNIDLPNLNFWGPAIFGI